MTYMDADAKQEWTHVSRQIAEMIAILHESLVTAGLPSEVANEIAVRYYESLTRTDPMDVVKKMMEGRE